MRAAGRAGAALLAGIAASGIASAGGPLAIRTSGDPFTWATTTIQYRTDGGPLSASVGNAAALSRVAAMFSVWQDIPSASISYNRAGPITSVGAFSDGDVNTAAEFDAVDGSCSAGTQSPVVFDANAAIFMALGIDETSVIGFAGPCALDIAQGRILTGIAVMNGLFQDDDDSPVDDLSPAEFDATFVHEFGYRLEPDGAGGFRFFRPDEREVTVAVPSPALPPEPVEALCAQHRADGIAIDRWTNIPDWDGKAPDYDHAVFCLASQEERSGLTSS